MRRPPAADDRGASAVEYGILIAGIAALLVAVLFALGSTVVSVFDSSCDDIGTEVVGESC